MLFRSVPDRELQAARRGQLGETGQRTGRRALLYRVLLLFAQCWSARREEGGREWTHVDEEPFELLEGERAAARSTNDFLDRDALSLAGGGGGGAHAGLDARREESGSAGRDVRGAGRRGGEGEQSRGRRGPEGTPGRGN